MCDVEKLNNELCADFDRAMNKKEIPTARVRAAFERSGVPKNVLAERLGWTRPNIDKLNRALGYRPDSNSRPPYVRKEVRQTMSYELAVRICEAINASPFDVGV